MTTTQTPATEKQIDDLRRDIRRALRTSYRFVLAYPNSLDTVEQDASALIAMIYDAGFDLVPRETQNPQAAAQAALDARKENPARDAMDRWNDFCSAVTELEIHAVPYSVPDAKNTEWIGGLMRGLDAAWAAFALGTGVLRGMQNDIGPAGYEWAWEAGE